MVEMSFAFSNGEIFLGAPLASLASALVLPTVGRGLASISLGEPAVLGVVAGPSVGMADKNVLFDRSPVDFTSQGNKPCT